MRIAQVSPLAESVPPELYGGTERIVACLTDELVALGHDVTLFASGDSRTRAELHAVGEEALRLAPRQRDPLFLYAHMLEDIAVAAAEFDVVHFHCDWVHLPLFARLRTPFVTTLHGRLDSCDLAGLSGRFGDAPFISISQSQRLPQPELNWVATVQHGLPLGLLSPTFGAGSYLAFLGRIAPEKGPDAAIRIARAAGVPLRIAAKVDGADAPFYREAVEPLLTEGGAELVGEIDDREKSGFLGNAQALVFPIDWPEPFGLVMIEAMACGTPVIAYRSGAVPEIIENGVTGFIVDVDDEAGAVAAIQEAAGLDRRRIRAVFERRFAARRMAEDYVQVYRQLAGSPMAAA